VVGAYTDGCCACGCVRVTASCVSGALETGFAIGEKDRCLVANPVGPEPVENNGELSFVFLSVGVELVGRVDGLSLTAPPVGFIPFFGTKKALSWACLTPGVAEVIGNDESFSFVFPEVKTLLFANSEDLSCKVPFADGSAGVRIGKSLFIVCPIV
jgi:hypothetical protein